MPGVNMRWGGAITNGDFSGWRITKTKTTLFSRRTFSRRTFLRGIHRRIFLPAPRALALPPWLPETPQTPNSPFPFADLRLTPHYPRKFTWTMFCSSGSPARTGLVTEKYAFEIAQLLGEWSLALKAAPPALATLAKFLDPSIAAASLLPAREIAQRSGAEEIEVFRSDFPGPGSGSRQISPRDPKLSLPDGGGRR